MSELMFKPEYGRLRAFEGVSTRLVRSRNHHDGDAKMARRFDLCVGVARRNHDGRGDRQRRRKEYAQHHPDAHGLIVALR